MYVLCIYTWLCYSVPFKQGWPMKSLFSQQRYPVYHNLGTISHKIIYAFHHTSTSDQGRNYHTESFSWWWWYCYGAWKVEKTSIWPASVSSFDRCWRDKARSVPRKQCCSEKPWNIEHRMSFPLLSLADIQRDCGLSRRASEGLPVTRTSWCRMYTWMDRAKPSDLAAPYQAAINGSTVLPNLRLGVDLQMENN